MLKTGSKKFQYFGFVSAFLIYLGFSYFLIPYQSLWSPDEGAKLLQLLSLRSKDGSLAYDIVYQGRSLDPDLDFALSYTAADLLHLRGEQIYFLRLPIFPLISLPFFSVLGVFGLYILPAFCGALVTVLPLKLLPPQDRRFWMWFLIAFASPVFIYSVIFWEHTLASNLALIAACLVLRFHRGKRVKLSFGLLQWILVGLIFGFSVYIRQEVIIFALAFLIAYGWIQRETLGGILIAILSLCLVLLPYSFLHRAMFSGQAVAENTRYLFYPFTYLKVAKWEVFSDLLIGPFTDLAPNPGWLGMIWTLAALLVIVLSFVPVSLPLFSHIKWFSLAISTVVAVAFLFTKEQYHSGHGLLFTTPWALLGIARSREIWKCRGKEARIVVLTMIIGLTGYVVAIVGLRASSPHGGLEWGARFALSLYPLLALLAAWAWKPEWSEIKIGIILVLFLLGFGFQIRGLWVISQDKQTNYSLNQVLVGAPERYIVSDLWWISLNGAPAEIKKPIFITPAPERLDKWVETVAIQGVEEFIFVTLDAEFVSDTNLLLDDHSLVTETVERIGYIFVISINVKEK